MGSKSFLRAKAPEVNVQGLAGVDLHLAKAGLGGQDVEAGVVGHFLPECTRVLRCLLFPKMADVAF